MLNKVVSYTEIAELCESAEGIEQLKNYVKEVAEIIDGYTLDFINDATFTIEEYEVIKKRLTGCVMYLNPILSYAETIKRNTYLKKYNTIREEFTPKTEKDKFMATNADNEAELFVASFREVRNMADGYIKSAESGIYTCKDKMAEKKKEVINSQEG